MLTPSNLVGMHELDARKHIEEMNYIWRVVSRDGKDLIDNPGTSNFKRVNLVIEDGIIFQAYLG
jgi:hypothetical protein